MNAPQVTDIGKRVEQYVKLRDKIAEIKDRHKDELKPYNDALEQLNALLLQHLLGLNLDSANSVAGTVYRTEKKSATIADQGEFRRYIIGSEAWDLCDWRANAPAIEAFIEDHQSPPPGVDFTSTFVVGVRRTSK